MAGMDCMPAYLGETRLRDNLPTHQLTFSQVADWLTSQKKIFLITERLHYICML